jgi:hypothetical protein
MNYELTSTKVFHIREVGCKMMELHTLAQNAMKSYGPYLYLENYRKDKFENSRGGSPRIELFLLIIIICYVSFRRGRLGRHEKLNPSNDGSTVLSIPGDRGDCPLSP